MDLGCAPGHLHSKQVIGGIGIKEGGKKVMLKGASTGTLRES